MLMKGHMADHQKLLNLANISRWLSRCQTPKTATVRHNPCPHKFSSARGKQIGLALCGRCPSREMHITAQSQSDCGTEATISWLKGRKESTTGLAKVTLSPTRISLGSRQEEGQSNQGRKEFHGRGKGK